MKVLIGGDYVPKARIADLLDREDFSYLNGLIPLIKNADWTIINLEAPIVETAANPIEKHGPNLKTTSKVVKSLTYAGIDMVTLANNHIMDYGATGLKDTLSNLEISGIRHVGVGNTLDEASAIQYVEIQGKNLAVINCCEHEFSIAEENKPGANPLNPISQFYSIQEAKEKADHVLVIVHGGHEMWQLPSPRMVETYRFFIDSGADAVINHHQHCFSGYETYKGKPIFYGLGNLCFESAKRKNEIWNYGYMVSLEFNDAVTFQIHPYCQCNGDSKVEFLQQDSFKDKIDQLNHIISDKDLLEKATQEYYSKSNKQIREMFEPYSGRFLSKLYNLRLLPSFITEKKLQKLRNYINCESHRDKVVFNL